MLSIEWLWRYIHVNAFIITVVNIVIIVIITITNSFVLIVLSQDVAGLILPYCICLALMMIIEGACYICWLVILVSVIFRAYGSCTRASSVSIIGRLSDTFRENANVRKLCRYISRF